MNSHSRGVLLIQRWLLKYGIQSDPRKARTGIHFVSFVPKTGKPLTVRVMACQKPIPAGGKGASSVGWWLSYVGWSALQLKEPRGKLGARKIDMARKGKNKPLRAAESGPREAARQCVANSKSVARTTVKEF